MEAVRRGGAVLAERFEKPRTIERKGSIDLVTDADRASEEAVVGFLRSRFPGAAVLAEESGEHGGGAGARQRARPVAGRPGREPAQRARAATG